MRKDITAGEQLLRACHKDSPPKDIKELADRLELEGVTDRIPNETVVEVLNLFANIRDDSGRAVVVSAITERAVSMILKEVKIY